MVNLMSEDSKEQETLTVYIHILATYLSSDHMDDDCERVDNQMNKKYICDLNDLVLKKLINLGTNHKEDFKQVLNKWPEVKTKIENAFKVSTSLSSVASSSSGVVVGAKSFGSNSKNERAPQSSKNGSSTTSQSKAPKIQLKTFGNFK